MKRSLKIALCYFYLHSDNIIWTKN